MSHSLRDRIPVARALCHTRIFSLTTLAAIDALANGSHAHGSSCLLPLGLLRALTCRPLLLAIQVVFRNNHVQDVCQLDRIAAPIWAQRFANDPPPDALACHHDYLVANNTFDSGPGEVMLLVDVDRTAVVGNTFHVCYNTAVVAKSNNSAPGYYYSASNTVVSTHEARLCLK